MRSLILLASLALMATPSLAMSRTDECVILHTCPVKRPPPKPPRTPKPPKPISSVGESADKAPGRTTEVVKSLKPEPSLGDRARAAMATISEADWRIAGTEKLVKQFLGKASVEALTELQQQGDVRAEVLLAYAYFGGIGVPKDAAKAFTLLQSPVGKGDARAQNLLGKLNDTKSPLRTDLIEAVRLYRLSADQGFAPAQTNLGVMYAVGLGGLTANATEAARLYRLAASQGEASGQLYLGGMYYNGGGGLTADRVEARRYFALSADQGFAWGKLALAGMYARGEGGLSLNIPEAINLYRQAEIEGDDDVKVAIGLVYYNSTESFISYFKEKIVLSDKAEAARLFKLAADNGNAAGQTYLATMIDSGEGGLPVNKAEAIRLYRLAAQQGFALAQANLGTAYHNGDSGLSVNMTEAERLFRLAANQGNDTGQLGLGALYENGLGGLPVSKVEALRLYRLAAAQGNASAKARLARLGVKP